MLWLTPPPKGTTPKNRGGNAALIFRIQLWNIAYKYLSMARIYFRDFHTINSNKKIVAQGSQGTEVNPRHK